MKLHQTLSLITILILASCNTVNQTNEKSKYEESPQNEINFEWQSVDIDGVKYEHGAMFLPVYLDTINREFKMQFDLGLNVSAIYENSLKTILTKHMNL